jgi:hypothetical protein
MIIDLLLYKQSENSLLYKQRIDLVIFYSIKNA